MAGLPPFRASLISARRLAAKMKAAFLFDPALPSAAIVPDSTAAIIRFTGTLKARPSSDAVWNVVISPVASCQIGVGLFPALRALRCSGDSAAHLARQASL